MPLLRFAPSPNGYLHLGHAYSALFTHKMALRENGRWLLRIEDIDPTRCRKEFVTAIFEDLHWLGLEWPHDVLFQSSRFDAYAHALEQLKQQGLIYPCFCTRTQIRNVASSRTDPDGAPLYPGTCTSLSEKEIAQKRACKLPVQWRLDMRKACEKTGPLSFTEMPPLPGARPQVRFANPTRWGDVVLQRKDTPTSYHLAVVVDDAFQNITHVTRGRDLEAATDIHMLLQMLLGLPTPTYTFHRLITDAGNLKLSKSRGSPSLKDLRKAGVSPSDIRTRLGFD